MITKWWLIGLGGFLGAISRYAMSMWFLHSRITFLNFPLGTMAVNSLGSFLIGVIFGFFYHNLVHQQAGWLIGVVGFLGSFTTFSTFQLDAWQLLLKGEWIQASLYLTGSVLGGLLFIFLGYALGSLIKISVY